MRRRLDPTRLPAWLRLLDDALPPSGQYAVSPSPQPAIRAVHLFDFPDLSERLEIVEAQDGTLYAAIVGPEQVAE